MLLSCVRIILFMRKLSCHNPSNMKGTTFLLAGVLVLGGAICAHACGGGSPPPPCSWTVCRIEYRDDWAPPKSQGRCVEQVRRAHHINNQHHGSGSCPAPQPCNPIEAQHRLHCKSNYTDMLRLQLHRNYFAKVTSCTQHSGCTITQQSLKSTVSPHSVRR